MTPVLASVAVFVVAYVGLALLAWPTAGRAS